MNKIKAQPIYIECYDHISELGWMTREKFNKLDLAKIHIVGYLTGETDKAYKVTMQICDNSEYGDCMMVIKSSVIVMKNLKLPAK